MALTNKQLKEILSKAGVSSENISNTVDEIMIGHNASIDALKEERDSYKAKAGKYDDVQKQLDKVNRKLQEYEESGNEDSWKVKYDAAVEDKKKIQQDFDNYKADIAAKELSAKKKEAYRSLLRETGVSEKRLDSVLKVSDFASVELTEDGKIKDVEELVKRIKSEWSDFIVTQSEQGANTSKPPQNIGGKTMTREEIMKIRDTSERQKAWTQFLNERKK